MLSDQEQLDADQERGQEHPYQSSQIAKCHGQTCHE